MSTYYRVQNKLSVPLTLTAQSGETVSVPPHGTLLVEDRFVLFSPPPASSATVTLQSGGSVSIPSATAVMTYATFAAAQSANISSDVGVVSTQGYYTSGDLGAASYNRVATQPSHPAKFQSGDGAWWELAATNPTLYQLGAKGDGVTYDTTPLSNAYAFAVAKSLSVIQAPPGSFLIAFASVTVPSGITVVGSGPRTYLIAG